MADSSIHRNPDFPHAGTNRILTRNIRALLAQRQEEERAANIQERVADRVTRFAGSMLFVYIHLGAVSAWVAINLGWIGLPRFDPTFVILATVASVEAIFLSTFVLISQNRMSLLAEKRAQLDLQISLLSEHEITRLLQLVSQLAERAGIPEGRSDAVEELKGDIVPEKVLQQIEKETRASKR